MWRGSRSRRFFPEAEFSSRPKAVTLELTPQIVAAILWMALVATVVTFLAQTWAQQRMPATHAAILFALEPVFTALFAAFFLGERMTGRDSVAAPPSSCSASSFRS